MARLTIDGTAVTVPDTASLLQAVRAAGVDLPTLCYHEDLPERGTCGMCIVKVDGIAGYKRACVTRCADGMVVRTNTAEIRRTRRGLLDLVLSAHQDDCLQCIRHGGCELQQLAERLEVRTLRYDKYTRGLPLDTTSDGIVRDMNKCIGCGRCVDVCTGIQTVRSIFFQGRGSGTIVAPPLGSGMGGSVCVACGQCVAYCPVGALYEKESVEEVWRAIDDGQKHVAVQIAPAVRVSIGEEFGMQPGELSVGTLYAALRKVGFDVVFDTNFAADLTIMEEGTELLERLAQGGPFPLITSCSPGWIRFAETYYPELVDLISSCKSPQQMLGALIKTVYAESRSIDPGDIVSVSIMPCTAKKLEALRPEMRASGYQDVDFVLTTREIARMIKQAGVDFAQLTDERPDPLMSSYTGAGTIFGATGGVMEAALRTAYELATGTTLPAVEFEAVRGMHGLKEAVVTVNGTAVRVAVAHGLGNAREVLEAIRSGQGGPDHRYHFVEIMTCTGGCVGGGGQPHSNNLAKRRSRMEGLYREDTSLPLRRSHENPEVRALYRNHLGQPGSERAHELLHTTYVRRDPYMLSTV